METEEVTATRSMEVQSTRRMYILGLNQSYDQASRVSFLTPFTFCSSFEENLAAAAGERTVMAARCLVRTDQARPLWRKEELHGEHVLSAGLKPAVKQMKHKHGLMLDCFCHSL